MQRTFKTEQAAKQAAEQTAEQEAAENQPHVYDRIDWDMDILEDEKHVADVTRLAAAAAAEHRRRWN